MSTISGQTQMQRIHTVGVDLAQMESMATHYRDGSRTFPDFGQKAAHEDVMVNLNQMSRKLDLDMHAAGVDRSGAKQIGDGVRNLMRNSATSGVGYYTQDRAPLREAASALIDSIQGVREMHAGAIKGAEATLGTIPTQHTLAEMRAPVKAEPFGIEVQLFYEAINRVVSE